MRRHARKTALASSVAMAVLSLLAVGAGSQTTPKASVCFGRLPLTFEKNTGHYDKRVKFLTRAGGATVFLTDAEAVMVLRGQAGGERQEARGKRREAHRSIARCVSCRG